MGTYSDVGHMKLKENSLLTDLLSDLCVSGDLPSLDDVLKLHKNLQTMRVLCNHFLLCVIGKKMENANSCWKKGQQNCHGIR